jgi:hypothetical protein
MWQQWGRSGKRERQVFLETEALESKQIDFSSKQTI